MAQFNNHTPQLSNFSEYRLSNPIAIGDTTIYLASAENFPTILTPMDYVPMVIRDAAPYREIVHVTAINPITRALTVRRGQEGTSERSWGTSSFVYTSITAEASRDMLSNNWRRPVLANGQAAVPTRISAESFSVQEDQTGLFMPGCALRIFQGGIMLLAGGVFVVSSTYSAGTGLTTVIMENIVLADSPALTIIEVSPRPDEVPKDQFMYRSEAAAIQAATSATTATTKAGEASTSATNAATSATTATTKAGEASTSATTATTKAGEASTSATNAATSATTATTKAGEASTSATNAATSATTATTKAGEANVSAANAAASAANASLYAAPAWAVGTAYNYPDIVAGTNGQTYRAILATTGNDPVSDSGVHWQQISGGANAGAAEITSAASITLTNASPLVQNITMTDILRTVRLPNATTMPVGGALFVIQSSGEDFTVTDNSGAALAIVPNGHSAMFFLANSSTASGTWIVSATGNRGVKVGEGNATGLQGYSPASRSVTMLTATRAVFVYNALTTGYLTAVVVDLVGDAISLGAPVTVNAVASSGISVTSLTSAQAICTFLGASSYTQAVVLDVSGTTITPGTVTNVNAVAGSSYTSVAAISSTQAICVFVGASEYVQSAILTVATSAISVGAKVTVAAYSSIYVSVASLIPTDAVCAFRRSSNGYLDVVKLTISGTTITVGTILEIANGPATYISVCAISNTQAMCVFKGTNNYLYAVILTALATTVTAGTLRTIYNKTAPTDVRVVRTSYFNQNNCPYAVCFACCTTTGGKLIPLSYNGTSVLVGPTKTVTGVSTGGIALAMFIASNFGTRGLLVRSSGSEARLSTFDISDVVSGM